MGLITKFQITLLVHRSKIKVDKCVCEYTKELVTGSGCVDEWLDVWLPDGTMGALLDA